MRKRSLFVYSLVLMLLTGCLSITPRRYGDLRGYIGIRNDAMRSLAGELLNQINPWDLVFSSQAFDDGTIPLTDARVTISGESQAWYTNQDGLFFAYNLPIGYKRITISHPALRENLVEEIRILEDRNTLEFMGGVGYYLAIGIEYYPSTEIKNASGAERDAQAITEVFRDYSKLPGYSVSLIGSQATKIRIKQVIEDAAMRANKDDYFVLYFAGHMGADFLSPYDDDGRYYRNAITDTELEAWLGEFPGFVTVILDGSDAATFADGKETLANTFALKKHQYTVLSSARKNEEAIVVTSGYGTHGLFTHYLIAGLSTPEERFKADRNQDGTITAQEIFTYVQTGMQSYQRQTLGLVKQNPELHIGSAENAVILRY